MLPAHAGITELSPYAFSESRLPKREALFLLETDPLELTDNGPDPSAALCCPAPFPDEGCAVSGSEALPCGMVRPAADLSDAEWETLLSDAVLAGRLTSLSLPASIRTIGRYAFYNCDALYSLSMYSTTIDLGQGLFTGCTGLRRLSFHVDETKRSSLYEVLTEFRYPLRLSYQSGPLAQLKYLLVFPEFYENVDENTPARITVRDLRGSGLMYRNCFADTQFQIKRYDSLFPHAVALEPEAVAAELAFCRLLFPTDLSGEAECAYRSFLSAHPRAFGEILSQFYQEGLISGARIRTLLSAFSSETLSALTDDLSQGGRAFPSGGLSSGPAAPTKTGVSCTAQARTVLLPLLMDLGRQRALSRPSLETNSADAKNASSPFRRRHFEL